MAIFSTFTSLLLGWRSSCVTSKSSNCTIVLINATKWETNNKTIVQYSRRRSYPTTPAVTRGGCMFVIVRHLVYGLLPPFMARWQHAALYGRSTSKTTSTAGWTVIVITIHEQLKPGYRFLFRHAIIHDRIPCMMHRSPT